MTDNNAGRNEQNSPTNTQSTAEDVFYDADAGAFIKTHRTASGAVEVYDADASVSDTNPLTVYDSQDAFESEETGLHRVPDHVIDDPVSIAERIYQRGFNNLLDHASLNDIAILYADEHTKIVHKSTSE